MSTVVARWLAAGDAGDVDAFDHLLHADAVIHAPAGLSTTGASEEKGVCLEALAAITDLHHALQEVVVEGDVEMARVVVTGTITTDFGGIPGTGRVFRMDQAVVTHLRAGKVAEGARSQTSRRCARRSPSSPRCRAPASDESRPTSSQR